MLFERFKNNPVLKPDINQSWEAEAVFNGCPVEKDGSIYLVYRAVSLPHFHSLTGSRIRMSDIGVAKSRDGINWTQRRRLIMPDQPFDRYGCEDPRVTAMGGKYYIFYTALSEYPFRAEGIKVALAISRDLETIEEKHLVTPFNAKAMALFPEKIKGKYWAALTVNTDRPPARIAVANFKKEEEIWSEKYWLKWYEQLDKYSLDLQRRPQDHIEFGAPPLKTAQGWLLLYSYIRDYGTPKQLFGVEAALLDLNNPVKVRARTKSPLLVPEEYYEKIGYVPDVVFPSGAIIKDGQVRLYYGATDTTCALATMSLRGLLRLLAHVDKPMKFLWRDEKEIISPRPENDWEAKAVFNPAAIYLEGKVHLLYRAMSPGNTSVLGYARSTNGLDIDYRESKPVYEPRESFEQKLTPGGNSGCEDPRLTKIKDQIYMCYTAYDGRNVPRVALTKIAAADLLAERWNWDKPKLISPPNIDDKDAYLFPEKIKGKYMIVHRIGTDIDVSYHDSLDFKEGEWLNEHRWLAPRRGNWDSKRIGMAGPPLKTERGWLWLYHGISETGTYRVGAVLTDLKEPLQIIARTDEPIFEPRQPFQKVGQVANVVFPCGAVVIGGKLFMYYGGADQVVGVATMPLQKMLEIVESYRY